MQLEPARMLQRPAQKVAMWSGHERAIIKAAPLTTKLPRFSASAQLCVCHRRRGLASLSILVKDGPVCWRAYNELGSLHEGVQMLAVSKVPEAITKTVLTADIGAEWNGVSPGPKEPALLRAW
mmetsp:Transcript_76894/g.212499  ORF Transcript_76894/g.212499 Transcript_76894/m.212499 type:complete len:123 (+) Transcript_76894:132-500(+)